jgi:hypothetical protein
LKLVGSLRPTSFHSVLVGEVGIRRRDRLKLDERPKLLDLIEMDADTLPQQQMAALNYDPAYADRDWRAPHTPMRRR